MCCVKVVRVSTALPSETHSPHACSILPAAWNSQEFNWFIEKRHKYLKKPRAQNYSVYVRNIPDEYRSNQAMLDYFRGCFSDRAVLEARLRLKTPALQAAAAKRDKLVGKLEHALVFEEVKGEQPTHRSSLMVPGRGETVDSIPTYAGELREANEDVTKKIEKIEEKIEREAAARAGRAAADAAEAPIGHAVSLSPLHRGSMDSTEDAPQDHAEWSQATTASEKQPLQRQQQHDKYYDPLEISAIAHDDVDTEQESPSEANSEEIVNEASEHSNSGSRRSGNVLGKSAHMLSSKTKSLAKTAVALIPSSEEGDFYPAGFVTFSSLRTTSAALQMIHSDVPFSAEVQEAPRPDDSKCVCADRSCAIGRASRSAHASLSLILPCRSLLGQRRSLSQRSRGWNAVEPGGDDGPVLALDNPHDVHRVTVVGRGAGRGVQIH